MITRVDVDLANVSTIRAMYELILHEITAYPDHSLNINALAETLVWGGEEFSKLQPPFIVRLHNTALLSPELKEDAETLSVLVHKNSDVRCHYEGSHFRSSVELI